MRLPSGGTAIDRSKSLGFVFDGKSYKGFLGDTAASALLGAGVRLVGRSFKYHRPRGIWGHGPEEPNAVLDVTLGHHYEPNARATMVPLAEGLSLRSVGGFPSAARDVYGLLDSFARFIPSGFYYKTFMFPDWRHFESTIRAMAGLGRIEAGWRPGALSPQRNLRCDVLVIGAGRSGLSEALKAAKEGKLVLVVDEGVTPGGMLLYRDRAVGGGTEKTWLADACGELSRRGVRIMSRTTAYGIYDHNLVCAAELRDPETPPTLWRIRPGEIVLATGTIERPLVFPNNDRPGIMSAASALFYLRRHGLRLGSHVVIASNNDSTAELAAAYREAGAEVTEVTEVNNVKGSGGVEVVVDGDGRSIPADALFISGGFTPTLHLFCQNKGKLKWSEAHAAFLPGAAVEGLRVVGSAAGDFGWQIKPKWPTKPGKVRAWIDFQNDVTLKDVALAARENFRSVEHLKRYTTLGMATDQGKTSNINGLAAMAQLTGRSIAETGTTTYRPPYTPVSLMAFTGVRQGELFNPVRRLALEPTHRAAGAVFGEYGGWLRPAAYGPDIQEEALRARTAVGIFDGSPLGKIEVIGPDAARLLDFNCYGTISTLKPGRLRYGFMLHETGVLYDDGVIARVDENRFIVSCSSSHVAGVHLRLEEWRQDRFDPSRVFIHNATSHWATITVTGPKSRDLLRSIGLELDLSPEALPHMAFKTFTFLGACARMARVSFSGDLSFEVSVPLSKARALLHSLMEAGVPLGATLLGLEAMMILRAEKGYIVIGKDTDGLTMPHDLGLPGPRDKRQDEFVGRRSLFTEVAQDPLRRQLVGLALPEGEAPLVTGSHGVDLSTGRPRSLGYVTSSYMSPVLKRPVALGLIECGLKRHGEIIRVQHLGQFRDARIVQPCAFDTEGTRLHV